MPRPPLVCFVSLLCAPAFGQLDNCPNPRLTLTLKPARLEMMLPELSAKVGVKLTASGVLRDDVLVIRVKDVPARELMERIAKITYGEWEGQKGGGFVLQRTGASEKAERTADGTALRASIDSWLKELDQATPPPFTKEASTAWVDQGKKLLTEYNRVLDAKDEENRLYLNRLQGDIARLSEQTPLKRLLMRLARSFDVMDLRGLPRDLTYVYTTKPNSQQRRLPAGAEQAFREYLVENGRFVNAFGTLPKPSQGSGPWVTTNQLQGGVSAALPGAIPLLTITNNRWIDFNLRVINPDGTAAGQAFTSFRGANRFMPALKISPEQMQSKLELNPEITKTLAALKLRRENGKVTPESVLPMIEYFRDPVANEWIGASQASLLPNLAEKLTLNLIAFLPDSFYFYLEGLWAGPPTVEMLVRDSYAWGLSKAEEGWWEIKPYDYASARLGRVDRKLLKAHLSILAKRRVPTLTERMAMARDPGAAALEAAMWSLNPYFVETHLGQSLNWLTDMRFVATLSPAQLSQTSIRVSSLNRSQRDALNEVFYLHSKLRKGRLEKPNDIIPGRGFPPGTEEPTLIFPNGIPNDASIQLDIREIELIGGMENGFPKVHNASELGMQIWKAEKSGGPSPLLQDFDLRHLVFCSARLVVDQGSRNVGNVGWSETINDRPLQFAQLPRAFRDAVGAAYEKAKEKASSQMNHSPTPRVLWIGFLGLFLSVAQALLDNCPNPTLALALKPARLETMLPELSAKVGAKLAASGVLRNDVLVLRSITSTQFNIYDLKNSTLQFERAKKNAGS